MHVCCKKIFLTAEMYKKILFTNTRIFLKFSKFSKKSTIVLSDDAIRYLTAEIIISQESLCTRTDDPITLPGRLDEPRYISGNGPDRTNSRYVMTSRYLFVTVHTT